MILTKWNALFLFVISLLWFGCNSIKSDKERTPSDFELTIYEVYHSDEPEFEKFLFEIGEIEFLASIFSLLALFDPRRLRFCSVASESIFSSPVWALSIGCRIYWRRSQRSHRRPRKSGMEKRKRIIRPHWTKHIQFAAEATSPTSESAQTSGPAIACERGAHSQASQQKEEFQLWVCELELPAWNFVSHSRRVCC